MKQAGLKNDGAWFRANTFIRKLGQGSIGSAGLVANIQAMDTIASFVSAVNEIFEASGVTQTLTVEALAQTYGSAGIPRWVWMGVLAYDIYTVLGGGNYKPAHAQQVRLFAKELRHVITAYRRAIRLYEDTQNKVGADDGNPGGVADDNIDT